MYRCVYVCVLLSNSLPRKALFSHNNIILTNSSSTPFAPHVSSPTRENNSSYTNPPRSSMPNEFLQALNTKRVPGTWLAQHASESNHGF